MACAAAPTGAETFATSALPLVLDVGSGYTRVGHGGGSDVPQSCFPTVVGTLRHSRVLIGLPPLPPRGFVGEDVISRQGILSSTYPVREGGRVDNWDAMEAVVHHAFEHEMRIPPEEQVVCMTEAEGQEGAKRGRAKLAEVMMESVGVAGLAIRPRAILAMHAATHGMARTALVLQCGAGASHAVVVHDGCVLYETFKTAHPGGAQLTLDLYNRVLPIAGFAVTQAVPNGSALVHLDALKEDMGLVALDYDEAVQAARRHPDKHGKEWMQGDGSILRLCAERYMIPELMFDPTVFSGGPVQTGVQNLVHDTIQQCDPSLHTDLYANIVLSGGSTMFPGFHARLEKEVRALALAEENHETKEAMGVSSEAAAVQVDVSVIAAPERRHLAWLGGSLLTQQREFHESVVRREAYYEYGPNMFDGAEKRGIG